MSVPGAPRVGVGIWTMQSTWAAPAPHPALYRRMVEDARVVMDLGLDSIWVAEHRAWYDGWCPAPLHALAHVAGAVPGLGLGTAVALAPQHDPTAFADAFRALDRVSGGRVELGLGLGHRPEEFASLDVPRSARGARLDAVLGSLADGRPVWVGGLARAAIDRAARHGAGLLLPQSVSAEQARSFAARYAETAGRPPRLAVLRDVWIEDDPGRCDELRCRLRRHYAEEIGSWWQLRVGRGFADPEGMDGQLARLDAELLAGPAEAVAAALRAWVDVGAELVIARCNFDVVAQPELHLQLARLAEAVVPALRRAAA